MKPQDNKEYHEMLKRKMTEFLAKCENSPPPKIKKPAKKKKKTKKGKKSFEPLRNAGLQRMLSQQHEIFRRMGFGHDELDTMYNPALGYSEIVPSIMKTNTKDT